MMRLALAALAAAMLVMAWLWWHRPREVVATRWFEHDDGYAGLPWPQ